MDLSQQNGLSEKEAQKRLRKYGKNVIAQKGRFFLLRELITSFFSPLILLLLGASFIAALLGDTTDFLIIFAIVLLSGGIGFFQHFRAEKAAEKLRSKVILTATAIRDGEQREIPFSHITIGDLIVLSVGDLVPADGNIIQSEELSIDESSLTGESYPAEKTVGGREKMGKVFSGTHIVTGQGKMIVTEIGKQTEMGKLSEKIIEQKPKTAFDKELESFSILILRLVLILAACIFLINAIFHHNFFSSFLFAVALAVGLTPELMPVIITISLSTGALEMEKKEVIVKFLPSIQNIGGMDILCMDKTGTITENNIVLNSYQNIQGEKDEQLLFLSKLNSYFQSGYQNPLDRALLPTKSFDVSGYKKVDEIPFDFERKKLSVIVEDSKSQLILITKGSPQKMLPDISFYERAGKKISLPMQKKRDLTQQIELLSQKGFRVIIIAKKIIEKKSTYKSSDEKEMTFLGFLVFSDPVKSTVLDTLKKLKKLGIHAKILTGDNATITRKVCSDAGIPVENILTGNELTKFSNDELLEKIESTTIFAELTPEQKAMIIDLFRKNGHIVGYLGDGINDAPPLKSADVGISVNNGNDIAKDVADIILMRKSLRVLIDGVIEGRKTYTNTFKYIMMSLSSNFGNMMSVAIASIFLPFLPLLPVQIILIDFLYDLSQITVPSDNVDESALKQPREWSMDFLKKFTFIFGPLSSIFDLVTFSVLLFFLHASIPVFRTGWFVESFITQSLIIFAIRTSKVPFFISKPGKFLILSAFLTILAGAGIVFSSIGKFFSFAALPNIFWIIVIAEVIFYFTCVELTKLVFYKNWKG